MFDPIAAAYDKLREDGQVWHEADVDGYHLYMADTSFGDGPVFRVTGHGHYATFQWGMNGGFVPADTRTSEDDRVWIAPLLEKAEWMNLLRESQRKMGYEPPAT